MRTVGNVEQAGRQNGRAQEPQEDARGNQIVAYVVAPGTVHPFAESREALPKLAEKHRTAVG